MGCVENTEQGEDTGITHQLGVTLAEVILWTASLAVAVATRPFCADVIGSRCLYVSAPARFASTVGDSACCLDYPLSYFLVYHVQTRVCVLSKFGLVLLNLAGHCCVGALPAYALLATVSPLGFWVR